MYGPQYEQDERNSIIGTFFMNGLLMQNIYKIERPITAVKSWHLSIKLYIWIIQSRENRSTFSFEHFNIDCINEVWMGYSVNYLPDERIVKIIIQDRLNFTTARKYS